jgi:hypothetical protein
MPRYSPTADEEGLYGPVKPPSKAPKADTSPPTQGAETPPKEVEEREPETTDEETAQMQQSAILPNKLLMGPDGQEPREGDTITLKIVKNYGDESEVAAMPKPKPAASPMSGANEEIDAMDQEKGMM